MLCTNKTRMIYFCLNFAKFLKTAFLTEHFRWLLLQLDIVPSPYVKGNVKNTIVRLQGKIYVL